MNQVNELKLALWETGVKGGRCDAALEVRRAQYFALSGVVVEGTRNTNFILCRTSTGELLLEEYLKPETMAGRWREIQRQAVKEAALA